MKFFLDECMNVKVDEPLQSWFRNDEFGRSGDQLPRGLDDVALAERLAGLEFDAVITSDIKQMRAVDRTPERDAYRKTGLHWIGVPQSFVKGRERPFVQAANHCL